MGKKDRMKKGLASLFDDNLIEDKDTEKTEKAASADTDTNQESESADGALKTVRLSLIEPDRDQPRKNFREESLSELADNIAKVGIIQPLLVRPAAAEGRFTIVAGERRWRAARLAGLTEVPVIVREFDPRDAAQIALIENLQREDLDPIEEAQALKRLKTDFGMTQEEIAGAVGKSRPAVANTLRLLELEPEAAEALARGEITVGHAKVLLGSTDREKQLSLLAAVMSRGLSVRELEAAAAVSSEPGKAKRQPKKVFGGEDKELSEYSLSLKNEFGIEAHFKRNAKGAATMKVTFGSKEELDAFMKRLTDK